MSLFTKMAEGAGISEVLGTAIGTLVGSAATTEVVAFTAPISILAMCVVGAVAAGTTLTAAELGGAVRTVTGADLVANVVEQKGRNREIYVVNSI